MLKFLAIVLALSLLASVWAAFRRRLKLAFTAVALLYAAGVLARLAQSDITQEKLLELGMVTTAFAGFWVLVWGTTALMARSRKH